MKGNIDYLVKTLKEKKFTSGDISNVFKNGNIHLFIAAITGFIYCVYIIIYFIIIRFSSSNAGAAGLYGFATTISFPHIICIIAAVILNIISWDKNIYVFALAAGIFYGLSSLLLILYAIFLIPSIVLCFLGFGKLKNNITGDNYDIQKNNDNKNNKDINKTVDKLTENITGNTKICPYCANKIKEAAIICQYCKKDLPAVNNPAQDSE